MILNFQRVEKKYLLDTETFRRLMPTVNAYFTADSHGESTVRNLYLDTPDFYLIGRSMEAPLYKEKLRIRAYGAPTVSSDVFFEIKKKFDGVVYKRREVMPLSGALAFTERGEAPFPSQINREIAYALYRYRYPRPCCYLAYDRTAFFGKEDGDLRVTFDRNIRYRMDNVDICTEPLGQSVLPDGMILMEIKSGGAMPLFLTHALSQLQIRPCNFSKYGRAYADFQKRNYRIG